MAKKFFYSTSLAMDTEPQYMETLNNKRNTKKEISRNKEKLKVLERMRRIQAREKIR